jgi:predicted hydrocarbon binding protein
VVNNYRSIPGVLVVVADIFKKLLFGRVLSADRGRITLFGRMDWILIPARALAKDIQMIGDRCGEQFLYELGYEGAKEGAKELVKYMGLKPRGGWATQKAVLNLLGFLGYGKPEFVRAKIQPDGQHDVVFHIRDNPVVEQAALMYGSKSKVCAWFRGIYAAHGEMELGLKGVRLKENKCICRGAPCCEWQSKS